MKRLLLIAVCCLLAVLSAAAAQVPDKTKKLVQKIEPSLQVIEKQLDEIEADFWKNVRELDTGSQNFLSSNPLYQSFNQKIVDFVSRCGALQRVLDDSDVDVQQQYPIEKRAIGILSVWKRLPQLHARIMGRRNPITREGKIALGADCIESIYLTSKVPKDLSNYEARLDDIAIINMELFYITQCGPHTHIGSCHSPFKYKKYKNPYHQVIQKYCKLMSEDLLITSAGEFFMAVRDLRKIIHGLRTRPYPEPIANNYEELNKSQVLQETDNKYFYAILRHIEDDLNQIEREFWDTIYKSGDIAVSNKNLSRYSEFQRRLYCLHVDCRNLQAMLRKKKIDSGEYNPVTDSIIIYNLGRSRDQELRRQMRRFFNRGNPLEPGSKNKRIELVYHFRAYDAKAAEQEANAFVRRDLNGTLRVLPNKISSYLPSAELVLLNIPERLDEFCASNIALFKSDEREFKVLSDSAKQYFNAVKGLRRTIEHWKNKFEPKQVKTEEDDTVPNLPLEELLDLAISKFKQDRFNDARKYLVHAAKGNSASAKFVLSCLGNSGNVRRPRRNDRFSPEKPTAEQLWLEEAAEAGYIPAVDKWLQLHDLLTEKEQDQALRFTTKTQSIWRLTRKLADMPVDKRDQWLSKIRRKAAEGDASCQLLLSYCYDADNIIDHSSAQAKEWLDKAVNQAHIEALLWIWGWRPHGNQDHLDTNRTLQVIEHGGIPAIALHVLNKNELSKEALSRLEEAGKRGDELAMCALLGYYLPRRSMYPEKFEMWVQELRRYRSLLQVGRYSFDRKWGNHQRMFLDFASRALEAESAPASAQQSSTVSPSPKRIEKVEVPKIGPEELFQLAINKINQRRFKEAQAYLLHLAEKDFVPAQYLVSFFTDDSIGDWYRGLENQPLSAKAWLRKAAEAGYVPAVERWIFFNNLQSSAEQEEALHFADRTQAIWRLARKLSFMSVDKRDQWLGNIRKQAAEGNAACQLLLSYCYAANDIIDHSPAKAKEWLQKAVDQEYPEALLWVWGWRPRGWHLRGEWAAINDKWKNKAIAKGGIPPIAYSALEGSDLPESTLAKLEDAGKRGDEMAMCALLSYYSKRKNQYPKQFEQWKKELKQYRSLQELIRYPFLRNWGWNQRLLLNAASKALGEKDSSDAPFGGQPFGGGPFGG